MKSIYDNEINATTHDFLSIKQCLFSEKLKERLKWKKKGYTSGIDDFSDSVCVKNINYW